MKDYINFIAICLIFIGMCFMFGTNRINQQKINTLSNYMDRLVRIEIISQTRFNLLSDKVDRLERITHPNIAQNKQLP